MQHPESKTDMTKGVYRRVYSDYTTSRDFSALSDDAEIAYGRIHTLADDYGNLPGDPVLIKGMVFPYKKDWTTERIADAITELSASRYLTVYEVKGEPYLNICNFLERQPAGRNGKRIQRFPMILNTSGESWGIQGNPEIPGNTSKSSGESGYPKPKSNPIPNPIPTGTPKENPRAENSPITSISTSISTQATMLAPADAVSASSGAVATQAPTNGATHVLGHARGLSGQTAGDGSTLSDVKRSAAKVSWLKAIGPLCSKESAQNGSDLTSMENVFDYFWPPPLPQTLGQQKLDEAIGVLRMVERKKKGMDYLTKCLKNARLCK